MSSAACSSRAAASAVEPADSAAALASSAASCAASCAASLAAARACLARPAASFWLASRASLELRSCASRSSMRSFASADALVNAAASAALPRCSCSKVCWFARNSSSSASSAGPAEGGVAVCPFPLPPDWRSDSSCSSKARFSRWSATTLERLALDFAFSCASALSSLLAMVIQMGIRAIPECDGSLAIQLAERVPHLQPQQWRGVPTLGRLSTRAATWDTAPRSLR